MTIDEAKICLSILVEVKHRLGKDFEANALQLGIEALKWVERYRPENQTDRWGLLPRETKSYSS